MRCGSLILAVLAGTLAVGGSMAEAGDCKKCHTGYTTELPTPQHTINNCDSYDPRSIDWASVREVCMLHANPVQVCQRRCVRVV